MAPRRIFTTCSYVALYGASPAEIEEAEAEGVRLGFRVLSLASAAELVDLKKVENPVGLFIHADAVSAPDLKAAIEAAGPLNCPVVQYKKGDAFQQVLQKHLATLAPQALAELAFMGLEFIVPHVLPAMKAVPFKPATEATQQGSFSFLVMCESFGKDWNMQCLLRVNEERLGKLAGMSDVKGEKLVDACRELVNQFLGVINSNLSRLQVECRIRLPMLCDLKAGTTSTRASVYSPAFWFATPQQEMVMEARILLTGGPLKIDLSGITFEPPSDEVKFL